MLKSKISNFHAQVTKSKLFDTPTKKSIHTFKVEWQDYLYVQNSTIRLNLKN